MWHAACGKANKVVSICMSLWSLAAMQMIKIITWSGSLYFSLPHTYTLLPPPLPFSIRPFAVFVFCSALQKTSAVATSKWWKWVFFTNKIKSKRCGWQNKKKKSRRRWERSGGKTKNGAAMKTTLSMGNGNGQQAAYKQWVRENCTPNPTMCKVIFHKCFAADTNFRLSPWHPHTPLCS